MRVWVSIGFALVLGLRAAAQDPAPEERPPGGFEQNLARLLSSLQSFSNWDEHSGYIMDAMETMYERNGWTGESDLASLDVLERVEAVPPWDMMGRFGAFADALGERYNLTEEQRLTLEQMALDRATAIFQKNHENIMGYAMEAIQVRAAGEPFNAQQVARWAQLAQPVLADARKSIFEGAEEFSKTLSPEQREQVEADLQSARKRLERVEAMRAEWAAGEWEPEHWGLDNDPIQNGEKIMERHRLAEAGGAAPPPQGTHEAQGAQGRARGESSPMPESAPNADGAERGGRKPTASAPADDEWTRYVNSFITKYGLDPDQQQRAWQFHAQARQRAEQIELRHGPRKPAPRGRRGNAASQDTTNDDVSGRLLDATFEQLKNRLQRLPTRAQRRAAGG